jgi:hypothetical protein
MFQQIALDRGVNKACGDEDVVIDVAGKLICGVDRLENDLGSVATENSNVTQLFKVSSTSSLNVWRRNFIESIKGLS